MQISVVRPKELGEREISAWHAMQTKTSSLTIPFLSPEFTIAVGDFQPDARVAVLEEGPEIVGFFPFEHRRLGVGAAIGMGLSDCQGLVYSPGIEIDSPKLPKACKISVWQFAHLV